MQGPWQVDTFYQGLKAFCQGSGGPSGPCILFSRMVLQHLLSCSSKAGKSLPSPAVCLPPLHDGVNFDAFCQGFFANIVPVIYMDIDPFGKGTISLPQLSCGVPVEDHLIKSQAILGSQGGQGYSDLLLLVGAQKQAMKTYQPFCCRSWIASIWLWGMVSTSKVLRQSTKPLLPRAAAFFTTHMPFLLSKLLSSLVSKLPSLPHRWHSLALGLSHQAHL